jgi:hypothetical protein
MSKLNGKVIKKSIFSSAGNTQFTEGQTIPFKFPDTDGFLIPESINISYTYNTSSSWGTYGLPLYSPILKLTTYLNDNCVEIINNYNIIFSFVIANGLYNSSDRVGMTYDYGLYIASSNLLVDNLNAGVILDTAFGLSGKLECILRNFNSPMPFNKISPYIEIQLDALSKFSTAVSTESYFLSNVEITYDVLYTDMTIYKQLKTFSYFNNTLPIPYNGRGNFNLNFNNPKIKYAKGVFITFSTNSSVSKFFESYDYTNSTGSYTLYFNNNKSFPNKIYYTSKDKKSAILTNYKNTIRKIYNNNNLSTYISKDSYNFNTTSSTDPFYPSKFIYAVPLQTDYSDGLEIDSNTASFGINTNYTVGINYPYSANLILCYDILVDITENGLIISK